jgi:hypothetical protein
MQGLMPPAVHPHQHGFGAPSAYGMLMQTSLEHQQQMLFLQQQQLLQYQLQQIQQHQSTATSPQASPGQAAAQPRGPVSPPGSHRSPSSSVDEIDGGGDVAMRTGRARA